MSALLDAPRAAPAPSPASGRFRLAQGTAAAAFLVVFAGGLVTSTGSALAVPDWPLSYGRFFPVMTGGVLFEHGHRMLAGLTGLLVWALAAWTVKADARPWARLVAVLAALGVLAQAVLGGVTVLWGLPPSVAIIHACLGQLLFAALVALAVATSPSFMARTAAPGRAWAPAALAAAVLAVQLALGARVRHTGLGLGWHLAGAAVAVWALLRAALTGLRSERPSLNGLSLALAALTVAQVFLGFGALAARHLRMLSDWALVPTAHQANGALLLGLCVVLSLRAGRREEAA